MSLAQRFHAAQPLSGRFRLHGAHRPSRRRAWTQFQRLVLIALLWIAAVGLLTVAQIALDSVAADTAERGALATPAIVTGSIDGAPAASDPDRRSAAGSRAQGATPD